jgi:dCTP deaminase
VLAETKSISGVFPSQWIRAAVENGIIRGDAPIDPGQIQPNSLDLRLGRTGCRVQCSFLPGKEGIYRKLDTYRWYEFEMPDEGIVLEKNQAYIFPLNESLYLPDDVYARANPKSSTGRLDVFTRLVTEYATSFDEVRPGHSGRLFIEVVPRSFAIRVRPGDSLSQIRFQTGDPRLSRSELTALLDNEEILLDRELRTLRSHEIPITSGMVLSVNLPVKGDTIGYQARRNTAPIDLQGIGAAKVRHFWNSIYGDNRPVVLEPDEFYIFSSRELVRLPPMYCAEMVAFDASSGEVRTHYAGFFDSGFGYAQGVDPKRSAASVVLEVRSRDVPFLIEDGQPLFRVHVLRSTEEPDMLYGSGTGSHYQSQRLRLSKQFKYRADGDEEETPANPQGSLDFSAMK